MDDFITSDGFVLEGVLDLITYWCYSCFDAPKGKPPVISVVYHFLMVNSQFLSNLTQSSPYLAFRHPNRLLTLFRFMLKVLQDAETKQVN